MERRRFLSSSLGIASISIIGCISRDAEAIVFAPAVASVVRKAAQIILEIVFSPVKTVTRAATAVAARSFVAARAVGIRARGIMGVTSEVATAYGYYKATDLWLRGTDQKITIKTGDGVVAAIEERQVVYLGYRITDLTTNTVELIRGVTVFTEPSKPVTETYYVENLLKPGPKLVEGFASSTPDGETPHDLFLVEKGRIILVALPEDVSFS